MKHIITFVASAALLLVSNMALAEADYEKGILNVCADPYMMPFSNKEGEGYENKIAELLAEKMGMELKFYFFPQRMGFIRNTLKFESSTGVYQCDLVITVPAKFELAATTDPYYATTYSLAFKKDGPLGSIENPDDIPQLVKDKELDIKFGITDRGPQQLWLFYKNMMEYMVAYQGQPGDIKEHPGQRLMKALVDGDIDATIVWGPTAAYYAQELADEGDIKLIPLRNLKENAEGRFEYSMSMAVRYGDKEWKNKVNSTIQENLDEIHAILESYGVPLIEIEHSEEDEDDD